MSAFYLANFNIIPKAYLKDLLQGGSAYEIRISHQRNSEL